ncbi:glutathione S-transferase 1-like [Mya arenaria]|uniref:glutathione S-transferase 1-like n=1 Tax=Mya arenaria TaxID=6604 RepID=UPI0022E13B05|nr:glutathione S-transferase 1-like [Mya arenaria]
MSAYKLIYFESRGVAELARLVFKQAGQKFEDVRVPQDQWPNVKEEQPMKSLPVLEIDGRKYCQSAAIVRYLGRKFGLMGSDEEEGLVIDELLEMFSEMMNKHIVKIYMDQDDTKKMELLKAFKEDSLPVYMNLIEKRLEENRKKNGEDGFYVGSSVTLGDLTIYNYMFAICTFMGNFGLDPLEGRVAISGLVTKVEQPPNIAKWIKERPVTDH